MGVVFGESAVNVFQPGSQEAPKVTVLADGSYVVVWQSYGQDDSDSQGIYAQRFSAAGVAVGPEWRINQLTEGGQHSPRITALSDGGWVVTWQDDAEADGSSTGVMGQRFNAAGVPQGANFVVNAATSSSQYDGAVAGYTGGFAAVWSSAQAGGNGYDIILRRFDNSGATVLAETRISTVPGSPGSAQAGTQEQADIAARADGSLVIVWTDQGGSDGSSYGVYGRTVAADGTLGNPFLVNTFTSGAQYEPSVAMLSGGGFVVVWRSDAQDGSSAGVYGQRFDAAGAKVGAAFLVNETTNGGQYQPSVTGLSTGGFVVTWFNDNYDSSGSGSTADVYLREYSAAGVALTGQQKLASGSNSTEYQPDIADLGNGNYVVVYADYVTAAGPGDNTYRIAQQIFGDANPPVRQADPTLGDFTGTVTFAENLVNTAPQVIDAAISLADSDSADLAGGRLDLFYVQGGDATDQLGVRHQGNGFGQIGLAGSTVSYGGVAIGTLSGGANGANLVISFNASATVDAVEALVQNLTYASTSQSPQPSRTVGLRISDGDGGSSEASTVTIQVTAELDGRPVAHGEEAVNTYRASTQDQPDIAVLADGSYVIAWESQAQDGAGTGVYWQRFAANGTAIGPEVRAAGATEGEQRQPHLAALSDGGFVLTWEDNSGVDGSGQGVIGQRYNGAGVAQGGNFIVNTTTSSAQYDGAVAGYTGGFAAVWSSSQSGGNGYDIILKRFDNTGAVTLAETRISTVPGQPGTAQPSTQEQAQIAARADGSLVVVWTDQGSNDGSSYGVYGRTVAANGTLGDTFLVNGSTAGAQYEPAVALLSNGGFVVVWRSDGQDGSSAGVYGQRFDAAGVKVGGEFLVNESTTGGQYQPAVTGLSTGGFVVSWYNDNYDTTGTGTTQDVYIREYGNNGVPVDGQRKLLSGTNSTEYQPAIADLGSGNFVVAYSDYQPTGDGGNNTYEIVQQVFGSGAALARQSAPTLGDFTGSVTFAENLVNTTPQLIDAAVSLSDTDSANFAGGRLDLFYVQGGEAGDQLSVRHQGNGAGQISLAGSTVSYGGVAIGTLSGGANGANLVISFNASATVDAVEALVQNLTYASTSQSPQPSRTVGLRISDGDGGSSEASTVTIQVTAELDGRPVAHGEETVNTYRASTQDTPTIAVLADGSYVIAWESQAQDGAGTGVYWQRFAANGTAIGPEVRAAGATEGEQRQPHLAALSDGGFVLTWEDNSGVDGSGQGVIGQRYNGAGVAQGGNFIVNTTTSSAQYDGAVAGYIGGFAAVWSSAQAGGNGYDIILKRFDNTGAVTLAETRISTVPGQPGTAQPSTQEQAQIAARADGSLVVVWTDQGSNDGSSYGVYGRTVAANGTLGDTFLVNTTTAGYQYEPSVALLSNGGFVVVWRSDGQDGSSAGVYGQRFDAAGLKVGGEFMVNESTTGGQYQPAVTGLSTGGFVVSWYNDNYDTTGTGTTQDVYIREYSNAGVALDGQRKLVSSSNSTEYQPAIADLGNGNFVVAYSDYQSTGDGGNNTYEIVQQVFGSGAALARQSAPTLGDFTGSVTFAENLVNTTPQLIDAAVSLSDTDSANFAGGRLDLFYVQGGEAGDQLSVRHQGNGAGQISLAGSTVSYGGVAIGTLSGGANGANLVITFNASATVDAVEALVQNLTYASTSQSPQPSRTVGLRISDGDGGSSEASTVTIQVTAELDGRPVAHGEEAVNSYRNNTQDQPDIAVLADGSYVIAWTSEGQDGAGSGVYWQRFAANGVATGPEVRAGTVANGSQQQPQAAALSDGGFVLVWNDSGAFDGSGQGVIGQRYNGAGVAQGGNFVVTSTTASAQYDGSVAGYTGGFAAVWSSAQAGGNGYDIYLKRFDNTGAVTLAETRISTVPGNAATAQSSTQEQADLVARADGSLVIVWTDQGGNDGSSYGVYGRTVAADGTLGDTFLVNGSTAGAQYEPAVALLSNGGFVVVWRSDGQDGSSAGVYGQRFDAAGVKVGGEFLVNESTTGGQYQPAVTGLSTGGFVVSWYNDNYDTTGTGTTQDVYIREYSNAGVALDGQRKLVSSSNSTEYQPAIADLGNGNFVVAYTDYRPSGSGGNNTYEVAQQIFGSGASLARQANPVLADVVELVTLSSSAASPVFAGLAVTIDTDVSVSDADSANFAGGALTLQLGNGATATEVLGVRHQGNGAGQIGVAGSVVSFGGVAIGTINGGGAGNSLLVIQFNAAADAAAVRALVENITYQNTSPPAGTTDRSLSLRLSDGDGGSSEPVAVQIRIQATVSAPTLALTDLAEERTLTEAQAQAGVLVDDAVQLDYAGATGFANGKLTVSYTGNSNRADDQLAIAHEGNGAGQVGVAGSAISYGGTQIGSLSATLDGGGGRTLEITFNGSATAQAIEEVIERLRYSTTSEAPNATRELRVQVTDGAGANSPVRDVLISITPEADPAAVQPLTGDLQANSQEGGQQTDASLARLLGPNNGGYVIAWVSDGGQDGSGGSIHLQRFAANGSAQGAEVQVNSYTLNTQNQPAVSGLADGGYVVAWTSGHDGSGSGVYAQRFNAAGQPAGGEFRVNTTITSTQNMPTLLGLADGSFVVAYESDYSNATAGYTYDVLGQRFAADGTPLGAEFTLNSNVNGSQVQPQLASLAGGGFVAAWTDTSGADGSGYGIVLQRFAADGSKLGSEIIANTTVAGTQQGADVVGLAGGGFVAVWHDDSTNSVLAQRFAADGSKLGAELLVSTPDTRADYNNYARVAALDTGGFVVTWDSTYAVGGSNYEVVAQQFSATGQRVDGVFVLNQRTASTQIEPDVVGLAGGNFVAAWSNYDAERRTDNSYGVFHRVFGTPGSVASSAAPVLVDLADRVTFDEALVNAGGQLIDASAGLSDADSANFDGGRLWVSVINGYPHDNDGPLAAGLVQQDVLGILSVGTGAGQVSVSGSTVSYGGVAIGVIELGGAAGADLVLRFNAGATSAAVEAVIESLTYANTSSAPSASRVVSISVSDGDGGTSDPRLVTVNVTPQADGPQPLFGNEVVNTFRPDTQGEPATAALTGGGYVTVWTSQGQDGSQGGVFGQRYTAAGERVGPEFQVNTQTLQVQDHPKVVGLAGGGFVVAWESQNQDGSSTGLYGQRFGADGAPAGSEFRINTSTDNDQSQVSLAALPGGGFVATWYSYYHEGTYYQIVAQRFDAANVPVGPEWTVNTDASSSYQAEPAVAAAADGSFLIVWRSDGQDGSGAGVYGQRFAANGSAQGSEFRVNSYTDGSQYQPDVAALAGGGYIVVWHSDSQDGNSGGVYGQRLNASGAPVGPEFRIHADIVGNQHTPSVTALPGGGFAVAWIDNGQAWLQQFAADGTRLDGELRLDTLDSGGNVSLPQVTALANGSLVATWGDYVQSQASYEVVQQLLANPATTTRQSRPVITDLVDSITLPENLVNAAAQLIDASIDLADADSANFDGGQLWVSVISGYGNLEVAQLPEDVRAQDQLGLRSTGDGPGQVRVTGSAVSVGGVVVATVLTNGSAGADLVLRFNAQATPAAVEAVVEALTYANTASNPVGSRAISISLSDGDGATSEPQVVTVNVTPEADGAQALFGNELVNTYAPDTQNLPAITRLADGGYVIVWTSQGQDGWGTGVHAQRFDANGVPVGSEFQANTYTPYDQVAPTAAGLASGGFVLMWTSQNQDGSGSGIFGQRFDANGVPAGAEFLVNTGTGNSQSQVAVAALAGGGFVATWYSDFQDGSYYNVYGQRFAADGAKLGGEFKVNTSTGFENSDQSEPAVAALAGGGFVVVWTGAGQDGGTYGIHGQRYAADGSAVGAEFQVNSYGPNTQHQPDVAALTGGGFVVVWRSEGQDGNSGGVFGQRYGSDGAPVGSEFRVNTDTFNDEGQPAVTALSDGGFAVTYYDGGRVMVQQFDAAGRALDNETRVDTADNNSNASQPAIQGLAGGAFVIAWTDYDYQSGQYQIYQQVFGNPALLTRQANPQLVDVTPSVTFAENLVNAVPQLIDPGVGLIDTDSANFDGGLLEVNYLTDYGAQDQLGLQSLDNQDQLGIRHEGLGAGQVGVVGSVVSFSGVAIGQIVSAGANGDKLSVRFNANASVEAVEQVIENLTYANTVSNPIASRTVSIRVTDGDGGASAARAVTINVTPQIDGAVRFGLEQTVNTTRPGQQVESDIARLADGGYVVVWTDQGGADGSSYGVYGQRYDADDNAAGAEFRINTTTDGQQDNAQVVGLAGGGHVVVWQSLNQDGSGWGCTASATTPTAARPGLSSWSTLLPAPANTSRRWQPRPTAASSWLGTTTPTATTTPNIPTSSSSVMAPTASCWAARPRPTPAWAKPSATSRSRRWQCLATAASWWCGRTTGRTAAAPACSASASAPPAPRKAAHSPSIATPTASRIRPPSPP
ncbi:hypothetical protein [Aquincola sp. J276]|uniref:beta strand repeat-containing protein n=1 Tax=Aquincola sp. J276 TaxID=2898432 RepID=UPI002151761F|nr:hypothetical protein [Aquincola sp. J276]MCR5864838.1 hypothetical protein [Aquincola sp. J276]